MASGLVLIVLVAIFIGIDRLQHWLDTHSPDE